MSSTISTQTNNPQTNNRAVTIYLAGTGNTQQTSAQNAGPDGRYPNGDTSFAHRRKMVER